MTTEPNRRLRARSVATWIFCSLVGGAGTTVVFGQGSPMREARQADIQGADRSGPRTVNAATAAQLAAAMEIPAANIVSASIGTSDPDGVGVGTTPLGRYFPRQGGTFAIISTGAAAAADTPDSAGNTGTVLNGLDSPAGHDMVQLRLVLAPPPGAQCLGFDFAFFSE